MVSGLLDSQQGFIKTFIDRCEFFVVHEQENMSETVGKDALRLKWADLLVSMQNPETIVTMSELIAFQIFRCLLSAEDSASLDASTKEMLKGGSHVVVTAHNNQKRTKNKHRGDKPTAAEVSDEGDALTRLFVSAVLGARSSGFDHGRRGVDGVTMHRAGR